MGTDLSSIKNFLELLGRLTSEMLKIAVRLESYPEIRSATQICNVAHHQDKTIFELYIDVETDQEDAICFWFEIRSQDRNWYVEANVNRTVSSGQYKLDEYDELSPESFPQLEKMATEAVNWLVSKARAFNFSEKR